MKYNLKIAGWRSEENGCELKVEFSGRTALLTGRGRGVAERLPPTVGVTI